MNKNIGAYKKISISTEATDCSPHRVIQMMIDGALDRISNAKIAMKEDKVSEKGLQISRAIDLIEGLKISLDDKIDHELTKNLESLYDYFQTCLVKANLNNDANLLEHVHSLLLEIKQGWDAIPVEFHNKAILQKVAEYEE